MSVGSLISHALEPSGSANISAGPLVGHTGCEERQPLYTSHCPLSLSTVLYPSFNGSPPDPERIKKRKIIVARSAEPASRFVISFEK